MKREWLFVAIDHNDLRPDMCRMTCTDDEIVEYLKGRIQQEDNAPGVSIRFYDMDKATDDNGLMRIEAYAVFTNRQVDYYAYLANSIYSLD